MIFYPSFKNCLIIGALLLSVFTAPLRSFAHGIEKEVRLYFSGMPETVNVGDTIAIKILIDSEALVNLFDIALEFSKETLELKAFDTENSIINFWKDGPYIQDGNEFPFLGGNIKGWSGEGGELITLYFDVKSSGEIGLSFQKNEVYYADGRGTIAVADSHALKIFAKDGNSSMARDENVAENQEVRPVITVLDVIENKPDGTRLAIWEFSRGPSSLKKTEVRFLTGFSWSEWTYSANPAKVPSNAWGVQIRAVGLTGEASSKIVYTAPLIARKISFYALVIMLTFFMPLVLFHSFAA